jgi:hypothetical protein
MHTVNNKKNGSSTTYCTIITLIPTPYTNKEMGNRKQIRTYNGKWANFTNTGKETRYITKLFKTFDIRIDLPKDVIYDTYRRIPTTE